MTHTPHISRLTALLMVVACITQLLTSCARMGSPDGGWFDETPPRVVSATPGEHATGVKQKRVQIYFNEFIKVDNPTENIVICPPQIEQPEIKTVGKVIRVDLKDELKDNTTYTIDFSDAISDNNEGNPLGNYTYVFSTGQQIDTLEVAGYVLNAEDLEPVKGHLVGLYSNLADSAFTSESMLRVGRTDDNGHFIIRGIAPGQYRIYALNDQDGNYYLSQRGEPLAFSHDIIVPTAKPDIRQDTTWTDSLHIAAIKRVPYTHFVPDDVCLLSFTQSLTDVNFIKSDRTNADHFTLFFSAPCDSLPRLRPLNFDDSSGYVIEASEHRDTVTYWLRDTALVNQDTLRLEMTYMMTDTLGCLVAQTDTLEMLAKTPYAKRLKARNTIIEKWQKEVEKTEKKERTPPPAPKLDVLEPKYIIEQNMSPVENVRVVMPTPLERIDTAAIHLYSKIDTLWYRSPLMITSENMPPRTYELRGEWRPDREYSLEIDSLAFTDIYGKQSEPYKTGLKIENTDKFSSLFVNVTNLADSIEQKASIIVELMKNADEVFSRATVSEGTAEFYYLRPGKYFMRAIIDENHNGRWDTGDYALDRQAERVFYYNKQLEFKEKRDYTVSFNLHSMPLHRQKPRELVKQKGEKKKRITNRNAKRAAEKGIIYNPEKL